MPILICEPVNKLLFPEEPGRLMGYDATTVTDLVALVWDSYFELQAPRPTP